MLLDISMGPAMLLESSRDPYSQIDGYGPQIRELVSKKKNGAQTGANMM